MAVGETMLTIIMLVVIIIRIVVTMVLSIKITITMVLSIMIMLVIMIIRIMVIMALSMKIMLIRNNINNSSNLENLFKHSRDRHLALVTKHNLVSVDPNQTGWTDIRTLVNM